MRKIPMMIIIALFGTLTACGPVASGGDAGMESGTAKAAETISAVAGESGAAAVLNTGVSAEESAQETSAGQCPLIRLGGSLYQYGGGGEEPMGSSDSVTGQIRSSVKSGEEPHEDGQSNFGGIGNSYCWSDGDEEAVVRVDDRWLRFYRVEDQEDQEPQKMVFIGDRLYRSTGRPAYLTCGTADGAIRSFVSPDEVPDQDGQANFDCQGEKYILAGDGAVGVWIDGGYILFLAEDTVEYEHRYYKKSDLSDETIEWLERYNTLPEEGKRAINFVPHEFLPQGPVEVMETNASGQ